MRRYLCGARVEGLSGGLSDWPRAWNGRAGRDARGRKQFRYHPRWKAVREIAGSEFTAKAFRTWAGTLLAASLLAPDESTAAPITVPEMLRQVSRVPGNTPAVCRSGYIHPVVLAAYAEDAGRDRWNTSFAKARPCARLTREETALLMFLKAQ